MPAASVCLSRHRLRSLRSVFTLSFSVCFGGLVAFILIASSNAQYLTGPFRPDLIGKYFLPNISRSDLPPSCLDFSQACAAEAAGQYEKAIQLYEEKYSVCSDYGWNITGNSSGSNDFVVFKTTPCGGLHVAIKAAHSGKECRVIKDLTTGSAFEACPGCFPRYYALSNFTHACYSEYVPHHELFGFRGKTANITIAKMFFLQGVRIVKTMRSQNWEHRDFGLRNIAMRNWTLPDGRSVPQLLVFDFGAARHLEDLMGMDAKLQRQVTNQQRRRLDGNGLHTDMYMLALDMCQHTYGFKKCPRHVSNLPPETDTLLYLLTKVMKDNLYHKVEPDFRGIHELAKTVTRF
jgi:hypothetical protein